jgi:ABC-2 type transport system permease protein
MRTILYILQKEFLQIFRDKTILPIIFVVPFVQLLVLVYAATFEIKNINLLIVDNDKSTLSKNLTEKFEASPFFNIVGYSFSIKEANEYLEKGKTVIVLHIPENFEQKLVRENKADIQLLIDAVNQTNASIGNIYCKNIISSFNKNIIVKYGDLLALKDLQDIKTINIEHQFWYNPELNYKVFMVPGILVLLVTIIGMMLSAFNLVREKEMGTIEQINVTPIKKYQFIIGKMLPFYIIAIFELAFGLTLGKVLFNIPYLGNFFDVFVSASFYLFVVLGFGLLLSTLANNQQQVMLVAWFFMMLFILMSGLFTSTDSMPQWAQFLNYVNPIAYFIKIMRMILLKGSTLIDVKKELFCLFIYGVFVFSFATLRYRKTT